MGYQPFPILEERWLPHLGGVRGQDEHDLQSVRGAIAYRELVTGRKHGHWMWFVFPQVAGLGSSAMAQDYAINSLDEARAYLAHPTLGARLRACADALLALGGADALSVFGYPDHLKLR
jgi:uncharacterized protein (DUF1810 family)